LGFAIGIILVPKGAIYANQVNISDQHRGLVVQGGGTQTKLVNAAATIAPPAALNRPWPEH
jgi:hypothetical protein